MLSQQPSDSKVALRGSIEKIFSPKISKLAEFQKLKAVICDHVDRLDEKNPVLMSLKANDIYINLSNAICWKEHDHNYHG